MKSGVKKQQPTAMSSTENPAETLQTSTALEKEVFKMLENIMVNFPDYNRNINYISVYVYIYI